MKKSFAIVLLLMSFFSIEAIAQLKIGYTNPAKILSQLPEVEEIEQTIEQLISEKDDELGKKAENLQRVFNEYEANIGNLSQQDRTVREQELMELNTQFENDRANMLEEVRQRRNQLMQPVIEKMNSAMAEVASEMELDLILNEGTSSGDMIIFFSKDEQLEVTAQI